MRLGQRPPVPRHPKLPLRNAPSAIPNALGVSYLKRQHDRPHHGTGKNQTADELVRVFFATDIRQIANSSVEAGRVITGAASSSDIPFATQTFCVAFLQRLATPQAAPSLRPQCGRLHRTEEIRLSFLSRNRNSYRLCGIFRVHLGLGRKPPKNKGRSK